MARRLADVAVISLLDRSAHIEVEFAVVDDRLSRRPVTMGESELGHHWADAQLLGLHPPASGDLRSWRELPAGGLEVTGLPSDDGADEVTPRWQVLTVEAGRITDIRGFEDRPSAASRAGIAN
jgi:hypothetical protein